VVLKCNAPSSNSDAEHPNTVPCTSARCQDIASACCQDIVQLSDGSWFCWRQRAKDRCAPCVFSWWKITTVWPKQSCEGSTNLVFESTPLQRQKMASARPEALNMMR